MARAFDSYQSVSVTTADPGALVVQLFDGALRFLRRAQRAAAAGDQPAVAQAVTRAHKIIAELSDSLDREAGGEVAEKLSGIYTFLLLYLTQGLLERNAAHIDRAIAILEPLREAFDGTRER